MIMMKRNPKKQLEHLIKGLGLTEARELDSILEESPMWFKKIGEDFKNLAAAGLEYINAMRERDERRQQEADSEH